jgi:hypothetical protein
VGARGDILKAIAFAERGLVKSLILKTKLENLPDIAKEFGKVWKPDLRPLMWSVADCENFRLAVNMSPGSSKLAMIRNLLSSDGVLRGYI